MDFKDYEKIIARIVSNYTVGAAPKGDADKKKEAAEQIGRDVIFLATRALHNVERMAIAAERLADSSERLERKP